MGQQHNTHVFNNTNLTILIALSTSEGRVSMKILKSQESFALATPHG
jgi:hypothetical protein